ncbi:MAG: pilus assembly protein PilM [Methylobacter sp.]|uniref:pilus assembly protein PilM n=1 Tax=Methylobacter sp. TaxID=2051955 RepID=UPI00273042A3|nr:pilus assembly protein PilM [Methylobacter sp.]MDP1665853.1 pilus assembly protein PilM [Methylobacter sp.]
MQLLKKLFGKKNVCKGIVGVSFLQNGIAVAISKFTENNKLILIHCEFIDAGKPAYQQDMLNELATQHNLAEYDCHLVLTSDNYRRVNVETPIVAENEIIEAIRWKINELIDFPVDKAVIDYYQTPTPVRANSSKMLEVIASPIDVITEQVERCTKAGLQLKVIDIQETTLRNLAVQLPENERGIALLYLLEFSGTLLIQKEAIIYVSRKFEIGYKKLELDDPFSSESSAANAHNNLALEIQRSLDYVESYYGISPISALAVIPLAENTHNLLDSLSRNLGIAARIIDLSTIIDCDILVDTQTQLLCAPVIGATLRYVIEAA